MSFVGDKVAVHVPIFSVGTRSIVGDVHEDRREVHTNRTGHGGHIHAGPGAKGYRPAPGSDAEAANTDGDARSYRPTGSIGSAGSVLSIN